MLHIRFDEASTVSPHCSITFFVNGVCAGNLILRKPEAIWLNHILQKGCESLSFSFVASGKGPDAPPEDIDACARNLSESKR